MWKALSVCVVVLTCLGCNRAESEPTMTKVGPSIAVQPLSAPLTSAEVEAFLQVVQALPDQQSPEPSLPAPLHLAAGRSPRESLALWRGHIREQLDPQRMADSWKHGARVHKILAEQQVDPVAFASLMSRISAAWVSRSLEGGGADLEKESRSAENRAELAIRQIEEIDRRSVGLREIPAHWLSRRAALLDSVQELVSLSEFLRLIRSVPPESREVLDLRREALAALLPAVSGDSPFERRDDRRVVPTSFEFEQ